MSCTPCLPCVPPQYCLPENWGLTFPSLRGPPGPPGSTVLFVPTYAAARLLNLTLAIAGTIVDVGGYSAVNDGGQGSFAYNPTSVEADNDGTILDPVGPGRLIRIFSGPIDVRWFGAKGNDAADDRAAIQAAIDYQASSGKEVLIPEGTYRVGAELVITNQGFIIRGEGEKTIIRLTGVNQATIRYSPSSQDRNVWSVLSDIELTATSKTGTIGLQTTLGSGGGGPVSLLLERVGADSFHVGFHLLSDQFCKYTEITAISCNVGVRLKSDATAGGANNNVWVTLNCFVCKVGIVFYKDAAFGTDILDNIFINPIFQGNSVCASYIENAQMFSFTGYAPEANAQGADPDYTFEGKVIRRSVWDVKHSQIALYEYQHVQTSSEPNYLEDRTKLTVIGGGTGQFINTDASSFVNFVGQVDLFQQTNHLVYPGLLTDNLGYWSFNGPPSLVDSLFINESPSDVFAPDVSNLAGNSYDREMVDTYGLVGAIQYLAVANSAVALPIKETAFVGVGSQFYCSVLVRSDIDATFLFDYAESTVNTTVALKAGVWTKVAVMGILSVTPRGDYVVITSIGAAGPKLNVTRLFTSVFTTPYELAALTKAQAFSGNTQPVHDNATDAGNAALDLTNSVLTSPKTVVYNTPITADRAVTLPTTSINQRGSVYGARYRVVRTAAATGAFNVSVGGLKNLAAGQWCDVEFNSGLGGSGWMLIGFGSL